MNTKMKNKAYVIYSDATKVPQQVKPKNGSAFTLQEMYKLIGTDIIEIVSLGDGTILVIDEEGKLRKNPEVNITASAMYRNRRKIYDDVIVGNAIYCDSNMVK